jgi:hypothetical protein
MTNRDTYCAAADDCSACLQKIRKQRLLAELLAKPRANCCNTNGN